MRHDFSAAIGASARVDRRSRKAEIEGVSGWLTGFDSRRGLQARSNGPTAGDAFLVVLLARALARAGSDHRERPLAQHVSLDVFLAGAAAF